MGFLDGRTFRVLTTTLLFIGGLAFLWVARKTFVIFLFAMLFGYLMEPVVARVERLIGKKGESSRWKSIALVYAVMFGAVALGFYIGGPSLASQAKRMSQTLPATLEKLGSGQIANDIGNKSGWSEETQQRAHVLLATHREQIKQHTQRFTQSAALVVASAGWILLVPFLAILFIKERGRMSNGFLDLIETRRERDFLRGVIDDIDKMLAQYIRAQLLLTVFAIIAFSIFLSAMRFEYALVLAIFAGILEFIPIVGPLITAIVIMGIAFITGYKHWLAILLFLGAWRVVQDYVNTPLVMKQGLRLHPLVVIFSVLAGGEVAGVIGMFLSIPVAAAVRILWHNWQLHSVMRKTMTKQVRRITEEPEAA